MEQIVLLSFLITVLFCVFKVVEMKYLEKEDKPLKFLVRDAIVVFICSLLATFLFENMEHHLNDFFNVVTETTVLHANNTQVFTDTPGF